jgi:hypothetical protein
LTYWRIDSSVIVLILVILVVFGNAFTIVTTIITAAFASIIWVGMRLRDEYGDKGTHGQSLGRWKQTYRQLRSLHLRYSSVVPSLA